MARASGAQSAERLNLARALLREHEHLPEATKQLAQSCFISRRQAYRYLEQAQQPKRPVPVGVANVSFTVKLSPAQVDELRDYAASTGWRASAHRYGGAAVASFYDALQ